MRSSNDGIRSLRRGLKALLRVMVCAVFRWRNTLPAMLALTDSQLQTVMATARGIDPDRRDVFLQRIEAMLRLRRRFDDADVADVVSLASAGLIPSADGCGVTRADRNGATSLSLSRSFLSR